MRGAPPSFAAFSAGSTTRTPLEILAHMGDLLDWALWMAKGTQRWNDAPPLPWREEVGRFFAALQALDEYLASERAGEFDREAVPGAAGGRAHSHGTAHAAEAAGGEPGARGELSRAAIEIGRVGAEQTAPDPKYEFD